MTNSEPTNLQQLATSQPTRRGWRLGLRGQLLLVFGLVLGLATLAAGGYQYRSLRQQLTHADDEHCPVRDLHRCADVLRRWLTAPVDA